MAKRDKKAQSISTPHASGCYCDACRHAQKAAEAMPNTAGHEQGCGCDACRAVRKWGTNNG